MAGTSVRDRCCVLILRGLESSRPAMNLLATLLWRDFHAWEWVPIGGPDLSNTSYLYDPIPDSIYWAQPNPQADL
jgi:hypothetical protein